MAKNNTTKAANHGGELDLNQQFRNLATHKYPIALAILLGGAVGGIYSMAATPIYRADAMVEIETNQNEILTEINSLFTSEPSPTEAEVALVQSRLVLGKTVNDLKLDLEVRPKYFPIFGRLMHHLNRDVEPELKVASIKVEKSWQNKPITLTVIDRSHFTLKLPNDKTLNGEVGKNLQLGAGNSLQVSQIIAPTGQQFTIIKRSYLSAIEQIKQQLSVISNSKTSPIISLGYTGTEPEKIENTLNSIIQNYVDQNRARDIQVASNGLAFISAELPRLRESLRTAENRLNEYRIKTGSLDIPTEAKTAIENLANIEQQITGLRTDEAGISELYTPEHPTYKAVLDKLSVLNAAKNKINQQIADLPTNQQEIVNLTRDVDIDQSTYMQLLSKQQELNILKASSQGNVRVVDTAATAEQPIKPRKALITLITALAAGVCAAAWYLLRATIRPGLTSSEDIEDLGLDIAATIPRSEMQVKLNKLSRRNNTHQLLAIADNTDIAMEAIRSLRTNLHFTTLGSNNKVLMISGAIPDAGKSFVAANLAAAIAQANQRVLLIDADMRKGYLDETFNAKETNGLAELLTGDIMPESAIQPTNIAGLDFISHGTIPSNPSELLMGRFIQPLVSWAKDKYDYIIFDTPPVLSVTDAIVLGRHVDNTLLVAYYNKTTAKELDQSAARFAQNGINITGVVFNGVERNTDEVSAYAYKKYQKKYKK